MGQLDRSVAGWLRGYNELMAEMRREGFVPTPDNARDGLARLTAGLATRPVEVAAVIDGAIPVDGHDVGIRLYRPSAEGPLPLLVYLHGGGHMGGSIAVYDPICRRLANASGHLVVAVEYRLAPEYRYPRGILDAEAVLRALPDWLLRRGIDFVPRLALAGDSGGGAMTASIVHRLQHDAAVEIERQVLIYPSLDYTLAQESIATNGEGYLLESERIRWYFDHYFKPGDDRAAASPLAMEFSGALPETLVLTAGFCPLRDEGQAYAERLREAGVGCRLVAFDDMIHAFMNMEDVAAEACARLYAEIADFLRA